MTNKLKTLKEIQFTFKTFNKKWVVLDGEYAKIYELRDEAIKWIKAFTNFEDLVKNKGLPLKWLPKNNKNIEKENIFAQYLAVSIFIKHFFNITDEELK